MLVLLFVVLWEKKGTWFIKWTKQEKSYFQSCGSKQYSHLILFLVEGRQSVIGGVLVGCFDATCHLLVLLTRGKRTVTAKELRWSLVVIVCRTLWSLSILWDFQYHTDTAFTPHFALALCIFVRIALGPLSKKYGEYEACVCVWSQIVPQHITVRYVAFIVKWTVY